MWTQDSVFRFLYNVGSDRISTAESELMIHVYLPEDDLYPEQRKLDLEYKKRIYCTYTFMHYITAGEDYSDKIKV